MRPGRRSEGKSLPPEESAQRWDDYNLGALRAQHPVAYLSDAWAYRLPLYWEIKKLVPASGRILEVGAGLGPHLLWLAARGYQVTGVDYRPPVVERARELAEQLDIPCRFEVADAFDLSDHRGFDLAFSVGMVEHWSRERTIDALREQSHCARLVLAEIPTEHTRLTGEVTDERFYSPRELRELLTSAGLSQVRSFSYGDIPSRGGRLRRLLIPPALLRTAQRRTGRLAMSLVAVGAGADGISAGS